MPYLGWKGEDRPDIDLVRLLPLHLLLELLLVREALVSARITTHTTQNIRECTSDSPRSEQRHCGCHS